MISKDMRLCKIHGTHDSWSTYRSATCVSGFRYICKFCSKQKRSKWFQKNREKSKADNRLYKKQNPDKAKLYRDRYFKDSDWVDRKNSRLRQSNWERKLRVQAHFGGTCPCGENEPRFLCVDHINDDGKYHRKEVGITAGFYRWLERNNFVSDRPLQLLCHSCNQKKTITSINSKELSKYSIRRKRKKLMAISHYSNGRFECACCSENDLDKLSLDHINGGGTKHRKTGIYNLSVWLVKNNFPPGFQVLCYNCNYCKGAYGECMHKTRTKK